MHWEQLLDSESQVPLVKVKEFVRAGQRLKIEWCLCSNLKNETSSKFKDRMKKYTADAASLYKKPWEQAFECKQFVDIVKQKLDTILADEKKAKDEEKKAKKEDKKGEKVDNKKDKKEKAKRKQDESEDDGGKKPRKVNKK